MRVTKKQLRRVIKEALEDNDPKDAIEKLADVEAVEPEDMDDELELHLDYSKIMTGESSIDHPEVLDAIVKEVNRRRRIAEDKDQNDDGENDFDDIKIARMKASGMSDEEIEKEHPDLFNEDIGDLVGKVLAKIASKGEEPQVMGGGGSARMARQQLQQLASTAQSLHDKLSDDDELPEWTQSKIAVAEESIDAVAGHLGYKLDKAEEE